MLSFRTYFCPVTGRGLESRDCVVRRWRPISPYADVPVLLSGWTFLAAGSIAFLVIGINLCESALAFGASAGITLSVLAAMRFVQQFGAYRRHQRARPAASVPKATGWVTKTLTTPELVAQGLHDVIVEFDRQNMGPILAKQGIPFPEQKRRKAFEVDGLFVLALSRDQKVLGYLELCPDWDCPSDDMYISSLQVAPAHRNGAILRRLLHSAIRYLQDRPFRLLKTTVQKNNKPAIRMYQRLGFSFGDNPKSEKSFLLVADRALLETPLVRRLSGQG